MTTNSQYIVQKLWNYCNILLSTLTSCLDESYNYYRQQQRRTMTKEEL